MAAPCVNSRQTYNSTPEGPLSNSLFQTDCLGWHHHRDSGQTNQPSMTTMHGLALISPLDHPDKTLAGSPIG